MANFNEAVLTRKGIGLLAKAQAGLAGIKLTKAASGCGSYEEGESLVEKEALKDQKQEFPIDKLSVQNSTTVSVRFTITNEQATGNLQEGYHVKEVGIFAEDPDEGEILYALATTVEGQWDYMPAYNSLLPTYISVEFYAEVSNAASVTIVCNGRFITAEEMEEELEKLRADAKAEHQQMREDAKTVHEEIKKQIEDAGTVPDGVLTEGDKGAANGVASLNSSRWIPYEQLPEGSGAVLIEGVQNTESGGSEMFKFTFDRFTWKEVTSNVGIGGTGWVGTCILNVPPAELLRRFSNAVGHLNWIRAEPSLDIGYLYARYNEDYADYRASVFSRLDPQIYLNASDGSKMTIKIFSESNLGESEVADVCFYLYILRKQLPSW